MLLKFFIHPGFVTGLLLVFVSNDGCFVLENFKEFYFIYFSFQMAFTTLLTQNSRKRLTDDPSTSQVLSVYYYDVGVRPYINVNVQIILSLLRTASRE